MEAKLESARARVIAAKNALTFAVSFEFNFQLRLKLIICAFQGETAILGEDDNDSLPGRFEIERVLFSIEACEGLEKYMHLPDEELGEDDEKLTLLCIMLSNSNLYTVHHTFD